ncbi:MAG: hypothetical protein HKN33_04825 [Pyrinomonadaceae bacterium]|nr:hypothetical protein [Pyrinomonadaceae bacterium]
MKDLEKLTKELPDPEAARRFYGQLEESHPSVLKGIDKGLLSDLLTIAAFSPLLSTTIIRNPSYVSWLGKVRKVTSVMDKEELQESLARFSLTNSTLETGVLLARFRRRELIRIYLKDIRGLGSIAEITEEISTLADVVLEFALNTANQELENRFGKPLAKDKKGKQVHAGFCICALGKLGSKELNYSSDIDLLFIYSDEGETSGHGSKGRVTNREFFIKLAEHVMKLVGTQTGEGAAYRVDMRLRPHGRVGALAISVADTAMYFQKSARLWERQVLIRSRASAGKLELYDRLFEQVGPLVFSEELSVNEALTNVRLSKEKINAEEINSSGFDVKLGHGGIREIEFIAQALQLAYGGSDKWLRSSHTLISLSRLADRKLIGDTELTRLFDAYSFLRRLEHRLQMEHGIQTHRVPDDLEKRLLISQRMNIHFVADFNEELKRHTRHVSDAFTRIFGEREHESPPIKEHAKSLKPRKPEERVLQDIFTSIEKSEAEEVSTESRLSDLKLISSISPPLSQMLTANPDLVKALPSRGDSYEKPDLESSFFETVLGRPTYAERLSEMRKLRARIISRLAAFEVFGAIDLNESRDAQTDLAEVAVKTGVFVAQEELKKYFGDFDGLSIAILGLGKLGGGGLDFGSDLDLVVAYDDNLPCPAEGVTNPEFYSKAVELFVTSLSSMTRDGSLYRVDLRLRPDGKNGAMAIGGHALMSYLEERAAVWEWLAYVKLRGVYGPHGLADRIEAEARKRIHDAATLYAPEHLRLESHEMRLRLEKQKGGKRGSTEVDIKFGEGGLQDVYFSIRYLQLRDHVPDDPENRSTIHSLTRLREQGSLDTKTYMKLKHGYAFLRELDHNLRLTSGRSNKVKTNHPESLRNVAELMKIDSPASFLEELTSHRLNIREGFNTVFGAM